MTRTGKFLSGYTPKGENKSPKNEVTVNPNEIIIKGDGKTIVNLETLKKDLYKLKDHVNVPLATLSVEIKNLYRESVSTISKIVEYGSGDKIQDIIQEVFKDVNNVTPNTIGMYFRGCYIQQNNGGVPACSAVCAGSFQPIDPNFKSCEDLVINYNGVLNFTLINNKEKQTRATIYLNVNKFTRFTVSDVEYLKNLELKDIVLFEKVGDKYNKIYDGSISNIQTRSDTFMNADGSSSDDSSNSDNNWWIFIVIAVVVIIILLVLLFGWRNRS